MQQRGQVQGLHASVTVCISIAEEWMLNCSML